MSPKRLCQLFAAIWLVMGLFLLKKGLFLIAARTQPETASLFVAISLLFGLAKGRLILARTGRRAVLRFAALPGPASILSLYTRRDIILILSMIALGILMRSFHVPPLIRGPILLAVGTGLLQGGLAVLRSPFPTYGTESP